MRRLTARGRLGRRRARPVARQQRDFDPSLDVSSRILGPAGPGGCGRPMSVARGRFAREASTPWRTRASDEGILSRHSCERSIGLRDRRPPDRDLRRGGPRRWATPARRLRGPDCGESPSRTSCGGCSSRWIKPAARARRPARARGSSWASPSRRSFRRSCRSPRRIATPRRSPTSSRRCRRPTSAPRIGSSTCSSSSSTSNRWPAWPPRPGRRSPA